LKLVDGPELLLGTRQDGGLAGRGLDVHRGDRDAGFRRVGEAQPLDVVGAARRQLIAVQPERLGDDRPKRLLVEEAVLEGHCLAVAFGGLNADREHLVEEHPTR